MNRQIDIEDAIRAKLDEHGREILDETPMAPPIGYKRQPSLAEQIREMVRSEKLRMEAEAAGFESFEEADDFEMDDLDPHSPYEEHFDMTPASELKRRWQEAEARERSQSGQGAQPAGGGAEGDLDGSEGA